MRMRWGKGLPLDSSAPQMRLDLSGHRDSKNASPRKQGALHIWSGGQTPGICRHTRKGLCSYQWESVAEVGGLSLCLTVASVVCSYNERLSFLPVNRKPCNPFLLGVLKGVISGAWGGGWGAASLTALLGDEDPPFLPPHRLKFLSLVTRWRHNQVAASPRTRRQFWRRSGLEMD